MDLPNRLQYQTKLKRAVNKAFKEYSATSSRMPAWGQVKADIVDAVLPVLEQIQLQAIRNMFVKFGDGPAPPQAKPEALKRATDLAQDLADVSIRRWKKLGKKKTPEQIAAWFKQNFGKARAEAIAITETTMAHQTGEDIAWKWLKKQGKQLEGYWRVSPNENNCPECLKVKDKPSKIWRKKYPKGPPSPHVNCQCYIEHVEEKA